MYLFLSHSTRYLTHSRDLFISTLIKYFLGIPGVRCDSGIEEGSEISVFCDPMYLFLSHSTRYLTHSRDLFISTLIKYFLGIPGVRCDSGIEEGSEISVYYDPMYLFLSHSTRYLLSFSLSPS